MAAHEAAVELVRIVVNTMHELPVTLAHATAAVCWACPELLAEVRSNGQSDTLSKEEAFALAKELEIPGDEVDGVLDIGVIFTLIHRYAKNPDALEADRMALSTEWKRNHPDEYRQVAGLLGPADGETEQ